MTKIIVGSDEVGRGAIAGPIVAGAVSTIISNNSEKIFYNFDGKDSKQLNATQREKLANQIRKTYQCSIGIAEVNEIDLLGITLANKLAIIRAINNLNINIDIALIDGNLKFDDVRFFSIVGGDRTNPLICAASIIAKVYRDNFMHKLKDDIYYWTSNVGYGTKNHLDAIKKYGLSKYHRSSFKLNL